MFLTLIISIACKFCLYICVQIHRYTHLFYIFALNLCLILIQSLLQYEKIGFKIEYSPCEWVRCLELAKTGKVDLLTDVSHSAEREAFLDYVQPAYSVGSILFWVKKGQASLINDIDELIFLTIGKEKGAKLFKTIDENPNIEFYESTDFTILIKIGEIYKCYHKYFI